MKSYKYIGAATLILFLIQCTNETKFEKLFPYQEKEDSYWGYIDFNGKKKIDPVFKDLPGLFYEGYALMNTSDGSYDYINKDGREHERNYVDASDFSEGIAFGVNRDEYPILLNAQLEEVKVLEKVDELYSSSEGLICFKNTKGKWGYMNQEGEIAIEPKYNDASSFRNELALVTTIIIDTAGGKAEEKELKGFIDQEGNEVIKPSSKLSLVHSFSEGLAAYSDGSDWGWGYIDKTGKKVIRTKNDWENVGDFNNGTATVEIDGLWGLINTKGELILNPKYEDPLFFSNGRAIVEKDDKFGFINLKGEWIIEPKYEDYVLGFLGRKAIVENDNYYVFINRKGDKKNKKEFYNIDFPDVVHKSHVYSDFFDIYPIRDTLISKLNAEGINGLTVETSLSAIMKLYNLSDSDLPQNTSRSYLEVQDFDIGSEINIKSTIYFKSSVSKKITQRIRYSAYYSYDKVVGYRPNITAKVKSAKLEVALSGRKAGKGEKLAKGLKDLFVLNDYVLNEEDSSLDKFILTTSDDGPEAIIEFGENTVSAEVNW